MVHIKKNKIKNIKLVITDIDGVWTDGGLYYNDEGYAFKKFSTYDGMGVELLKKSNIETAIISSELSKTVEARAKKLNIKYVYIGEKHKLKRIIYLNFYLKVALQI